MNAPRPGSPARGGAPVRRPLRAVFFDVIGTLARTVPEQEVLLSRAAALHGLALPPAAARRGLAAAGAWWQQQVAQRPLSQRSEAERRTLYRDFDQRVMEAAGFDLDQGATGAIFTTLLALGETSRLEAFDDAVPALQALAGAGYILGAVSNMDATLQATLEALDLGRYFSVVVNSQEAGVTKPAPGIFHLAAAQAGVPPEEAAYVGDQPQIDVRGAAAAGMLPVLVDRAGAFPDAAPALRIASLLELPGLLGGPPQ